MEKPYGPAQKCPHCGGSNIAANVSVGQTAEVGKIGLSYKTRFFVIGTEPFYADVCKDCGTVARIYVKATDRNWYTI